MTLKAAVTAAGNRRIERKGFLSGKERKGFVAMETLAHGSLATMGCLKFFYVSNDRRVETLKIVAQTQILVSSRPYNIRHLFDYVPYATVFLLCYFFDCYQPTLVPKNSCIKKCQTSPFNVIYICICFAELCFSMSRFTFFVLPHV